MVSSSVGSSTDGQDRSDVEEEGGAGANDAPNPYDSDSERGDGDGDGDGDEDGTVGADTDAEENSDGKGEGEGEGNVNVRRARGSNGGLGSAEHASTASERPEEDDSGAESPKGPLASGRAPVRSSRRVGGKWTPERSEPTSAEGKDAEDETAPSTMRSLASSRGGASSRRSGRETVEGDATSAAWVVGDPNGAGAPGLGGGRGTGRSLRRVPPPRLPSVPIPRLIPNAFAVACREGARQLTMLSAFFAHLMLEQPTMYRWSLVQRVAELGLEACLASIVPPATVPALTPASARGAGGGSAASVARSVASTGSLPEGHPSLGRAPSDDSVRSDRTGTGTGTGTPSESLDSLFSGAEPPVAVREWRFPFGEACVRKALGLAYFAGGFDDAAKLQLGMALSSFRALRCFDGEAATQVALALVHRELGNSAFAHKSLERAARGFLDRCGMKGAATACLWELAHVCERLAGRETDAQRHFAEARRLHGELRAREERANRALHGDLANTSAPGGGGFASGSGSSSSSSSSSSSTFSSSYSHRGGAPPAGILHPPVALGVGAAARPASGFGAPVLPLRASGAAVSGMGVASSAVAWGAGVTGAGVGSAPATATATASGGVGGVAGAPAVAGGSASSGPLGSLRASLTGEPRGRGFLSANLLAICLYLPTEGFQRVQQAKAQAARPGAHPASGSAETLSMGERSVRRDQYARSLQRRMHRRSSSTSTTAAATAAAATTAPSTGTPRGR